MQSRVFQWHAIASPDAILGRIEALNRTIESDEYDLDETCELDDPDRCLVLHERIEGLQPLFYWADIGHAWWLQ